MRVKLPLNKTIFIAARRKKSGDPEFLSRPGANTDANRRLLLPSTDSQVVHVNEQTGDDGTGDGSQGNPFKTYAKARTEIDGSGGSLTTVEWQTDDGLRDDLDRPTQASIGVAPQLLSLSTTFVAGGTTGAQTQLEGLANDNRGRWIAVAFISSGVPGAFITDTNGASWSTVDISSALGSGNATGIATDGNSNWVVVGISGIAFSSDNGATWSAATTPSFGGTPIRAVATDRNGNWVAGGDGKIAFSSDNGDNWVQASSPSFGVEAVRGITTDRNGNWVTVGDRGQIVLSTDNGDNWVSATTTSFGLDAITSVTTDRSGRWVATGNLAKAAFSTDNGDNWTQASATNFAGQIRSVTTDTKGEFVAGGLSGKIIVSVDGGDNWVAATEVGFISILAITSDEEGNYIAGENNNSQVAGPTITADAAGFIIRQIQVRLFGTFLNLLNCTLVSSDANSTLLVDTTIIDILGCRIENTANAIGIEIEADFPDVEIEDTLVIASAAINYLGISSITTASYQLINNTIIGDIVISVTGTPTDDTLQIRDNIIEGNVSSGQAFTMESGNVRGTVTTILVTNNVLSQDPLFADLIDFQLQRETDGFPFDSNLVHASLFSILPDGTARDMGAYNVDDSNVGFVFREAEFFPKPANQNAIEFSKLIRSNLQIGSIAEPTVYNDPDRQTDIINLKWDSLFTRFTDFVDRLEDERDLTVQLAIDPQIQQTLPSITTDGAHSVGDIVLNIDPITILGGTILTIVNKSYFVIYSDPGFANAIRLVLDRPLEDAVPDATVIVSTFPVTLGEFLYVPQREKRLSRPADNANDLETGLTMQFVRKRER